MKTDLFLLGAEVLKYFGFFYVIRAFLVSRNLMYASTMHQSLAAKRKLPIITKTCTDCSTIDRYLHLIDMDLFFFKHNSDICNIYLLENFDQLVKQYPKIRYYFTLQNDVKQRVNSQDYFESYSSIGKILGSNLKKKRSFFRSLNAMGLI